MKTKKKKEMKQERDERRDLRGSVHDVLKRWENGEKPFRNKFKVAVTHIIH